MTVETGKYQRLISVRAQVSSRVNEANPDHLVPCNIDGSSWLRITVWYPGNESDRLDLPLFTHQLDMARQVRDIVAVPVMVREHPGGFIRARTGLRQGC